MSLRLKRRPDCFFMIMSQIASFPDLLSREIERLLIKLLHRFMFLL
jgi:hypothetical protein